MLNSIYDTALNLMLSTDGELSELITRMVEAVPQNMKKKIEKLEKEDSKYKGNTAWDYFNDGEYLSLSVGDKNNSSKDFMNLCVKNIKKSDVLDLGRHSSEVNLGYVTFYLNSRVRKEKAVQLRYNFNLKKSKNNYYIEVKCDGNNYLQDRIHLIEINGLKSLVEKFSNGSGIFPVKDIEQYFAFETKKANI